VKRVASALVIAIFGGCTHTVVRQYECPSPPRPPSRSAIGWSPSGRTGELIGSVVAVSNSMPVTAAQIVLTPVSHGTRPITASSDSAGRIKIDFVPPGTYLLSLRRIGYRPVSDTLNIPPDTGILIKGVLAIDFVTLDGCGYLFVNKRVPWWVRH
jgi:hypothetical protein